MGKFYDVQSHHSYPNHQELSLVVQSHQSFLHMFPWIGTYQAYPSSWVAITPIRFWIMSVMINVPHTIEVALVIACTVMIIIMMIFRIDAHPHQRETVLLLVTMILSGLKCLNEKCKFGEPRSASPSCHKHSESNFDSSFFTIHYDKKSRHMSGPSGQLSLLQPQSTRNPTIATTDNKIKLPTNLYNHCSDKFYHGQKLPKNYSKFLMLAIQQHKNLSWKSCTSQHFKI